MTGYEVLNDELIAHAGKVDALANRLRTASEAANTVTMDNSAYGVVCQPFALMLQPFEELGVRTLKQAADTVAEAARKLRDTAEHYETTDATMATALKGIGGEL
jgi:hypothetical protein